MSNFVFDPLTGEVTILAEGRAKRADQTGAVSTIVDKGEKKKITDYFAKGNEDLTPPTIYQDADDWNVRVFDNKFPLMEDHEVVVHSPDPEKDIEDFPREQNVRILRAYLNRAGFYGSREKEVIIFNNRGGKAGASILHPHSQIVAAKGFPGIIEKEKSSALRYFNEKNSCYWCDEIQNELKDSACVVYESPHFLVYVPKACRWGYETRILPKEHKPNFGYVNEQEIQDLADVLKALLLAYDVLFDRPDRNFWIHTMRYEPYHWHIGVMCHLKVLGALELGAGFWVSTKPSEDAAAELKEKFKIDDKETMSLVGAVSVEKDKTPT